MWLYSTRIVYKRCIVTVFHMRSVQKVYHLFAQCVTGVHYLHAQCMADEYYLSAKRIMGEDICT